MEKNCFNHKVEIGSKLKKKQVKEPNYLAGKLDIVL